jgi:hypothetical protein
MMDLMRRTTEAIEAFGSDHPKGDIRSVAEFAQLLGRQRSRINPRRLAVLIDSLAPPKWSIESGFPRAVARGTAHPASGSSSGSISPLSSRSSLPLSNCNSWPKAHLVDGRTLRCELNGQQTHDRCVGICYLDGKDISAEMVRQGVARDCPRFSGGRYRIIEAGATKDGATIARIYPLPGYCRAR